MIEGKAGESIKYGASVVIHMKEWSSYLKNSARLEKNAARAGEIEDFAGTLSYLEMRARNCSPREASRFLCLIIKLRALMIIKKHC